MPSITIDDDSGTIEDAFLQVSAPTLNFGIRDRFTLRYLAANNINLGVIKVDLSAYPDVLITVAKFGVDIYTDQAAPADLEWYELYRDWVEGTKNGAEEVGSVCAQSAKFGTVDWTTEGARGDGTDRNGTKDGTKQLPLLADHDWEIPLTNALVQKWIDNSNDNHGLQLIPKEIGGKSVTSAATSETAIYNKPYFYMEYISLDPDFVYMVDVESSSPDFSNTEMTTSKLSSVTMVQ